MWQTDWYNIFPCSLFSLSIWRQQTLWTFLWPQCPSSPVLCCDSEIQTHTRQWHGSVCSGMNISNKCNLFFYVWEAKERCVCSLVYQADSGELGGGLSISQSKKGGWRILRTLNHSSCNPCVLSDTHWLVVLSLLWPQARSAFLGLCVVVSCSGLTDQNSLKTSECWDTACCVPAYRVRKACKVMTWTAAAADIKGLGSGDRNPCRSRVQLPPRKQDTCCKQK